MIELPKSNDSLSILEQKSNKDTELKFFHTTKLAKVGVKQSNLMLDENRRRQAKFVIGNQTLQMSSRILTNKNPKRSNAAVQNSVSEKC